ncbi:hypothetical protein DW120_14835 [Absiella sp. AM10-20]|jgi:hypothetical protein|nr:hypothetical protein DW271_14700 [Absiella sp. AM22-9]RGB57240.1 hypothetical protein DW120_14835 [Absiella sp. AM10-20]RHU06202.1 hypothetical protein DW716_11940 [Absiella sp. AM27-20]
MKFKKIVLYSTLITCIISAILPYFRLFKNLNYILAGGIQIGLMILIFIELVLVIYIGVKE